MIIITTSHGKEFNRLFRAMAASVERNCDRSVELRHLDMPEYEIIEGIPEHCPANLAKMQAWHRRFMEVEDGERVVLMDCDTIVRRNLDDAFETEFDVAFTTRPGRASINSGVVYLRSNDRARTFTRGWLNIHQRLLSPDQRKHVRARCRVYGGLSQAAFSHALNAIGENTARTAELPCWKYNCVDQTWRDFDPDETAVVHIKGALRRWCFDDDVEPEQNVLLEPLIREWREYDSLSHQEAI